MPSALPAVPFTAAALVLLTLPHHWRVGNFATLSIIAWLTTYDLIYGINAVIWNGNVEIVAPVWCDIATKVKIGADVGLPGCCLCMAKRLSRIAYGLEMSPRGWGHRALDIFLCWGSPVLIMALHYIVQGHRFDIVENIGCLPAIYLSWPSLLILDLIPFIYGFLAFVFCLVALTRLLRRRLALGAVLHKPNPSLTPSRYIRLMVMTFVLGTWSAVLISFSAANEFKSGLLPYVSWEYVHYGFSFIGQSPTDTLDPGTLFCIYFLWGAVAVSSLSFFLFFGLGVDAMSDYRACAAWVARVVFRIKHDPETKPILETTIISTCDYDSGDLEAQREPEKYPGFVMVQPERYDPQYVDGYGRYGGIRPLPPVPTGILSSHE